MLFKLDATILITTVLLIKSIECESKPYHYYEEANSSLCNFFDTINITSGNVNSDKSITFDGVRYAKENYATFNYTYLPNQSKIAVAPYKRGCVCKYKNCVRLCCAVGHSSVYKGVGDIEKHYCVHNSQFKSNTTEILDDAVHKAIYMVHNVNLTIVSEKPCRIGFRLENITDSLVEWELLSNGSLLVGANLIQNHDKYCLSQIFNKTSGEFNLEAILCSTSLKLEQTIVGVLIYVAVMLVSVCFLSLTLLIYIWFGELRRTIHGKNLMCYLVTLIVGYSFLLFTHIENSHTQKGKLKCLIFAEIIHSSFICGFIWLSVISFDIWKTIGRMDNYRNHFFKNCIFAYGLTFVIVLVTNLMDIVEFMPEDFRPGLGKSKCWIQDSKHAHFWYLYSIIIIVLIINTVFFIMTKLKIEGIKQKLNATNSKGSRKFPCEETDVDRFGIYLRLFILMGIPWIVEIISWLLHIEHFIIYVMDIVTRLQGPIIFFLIIKKRHLNKLIKQRSSKTSSQQNS